MEQPDPRVERVPLDDLALHPRNVREGDVGAIMESLRHHGQYRPIVVQRATPEGEPRMVILAGNHTARAAKELGWSHILAALVDVTDEQGIEIMLADNRTHDLGRDREEDLAALLASLDSSSLARTAWTRDDLDEMIEDLDRDAARRKQGQTDPNDVPQDTTAVGIERGDLFALGRHRLLVGDSADPADVARLLGGAKPRLLVTDPPYGVQLDPRWRDGVFNAMGAAEQPYMQEDKNATISGDTIVDWSHAFALVPSLEVAYVWHAGVHAAEVARGLESLGFVIRSQIIWAKTQLVISRGDYHWQHEPCWYAVRKGKTAEWVGDRTLSTVWTLASPKMIMAGSAEERYDHPAQKPIETMQRPIANHRGDVYEPFVGSGTTIIGAEREGRACYGMEIEPRYARIAIDRWQAYTGETAVKVEE